MEILRKTEIFRNLTDGQIAEILHVSRIVTFPEGEVIMREGEAGDTMYIILEGIVEVAKSLVLPNRNIVSYHPPYHEKNYRLSSTLGFDFR